MSNAKEIQKELSELSPLLAERKKKNPYRVPTDYFVKLEEDVMTQIQPLREVDSEQKQSIFTPFIHLAEQLFAPKYRWQLAGLVTMILGVTLFWFNQNNLSPSTDIMANITVEEVNDYIVDNMDEFDEDLLVDYMSETDIGMDELQLDLSDKEMDELLDDILDEMEFDELDELAPNPLELTFY